MTTAIERAPSSGALALASDQHDWTPEQAAALTQLGLEEATAADLKVFLHQSQRTGLDPFARQIYMIGRWDGRAGKKKFTIQSSIDGLRIVAERHGQYGGQVGPEWCGDDGVWRDVWVSKKPPTAARVGVVRKDWSQPTYAVALFSEYAATKKDGNLEPMWASKSALMIAKCAEALALRKAFPHDLSGIYTSDEMAQADNPPVRLVIDQPAEEKPAPKAAPAESTVDWDAEIAKCGGDKAQLGLLWRRVPIEVRPKVEAAAKAPKPAKAEEMPLVVDAVLVEDEPAPPLGASQLLDGLLAADTEDKVDALTIKIGADPKVGRVNVTGILSGPAAEVLGIVRGDKRTSLTDLARAVRSFVGDNGYSVNNGKALAAAEIDDKRVA